MEGRHDDLGRGSFFRGVYVYRDSAAIIADGDAVIVVDEYVDAGAKTSDRFVDGVVDYLVDEVVEAIGTRRPDVHGRSFPNRVEAFEDLDSTGVVAQARGFLALIRTGESGSGGEADLVSSIADPRSVARGPCPLLRPALTIPRGVWVQRARRGRLPGYLGRYRMHKTA